MKLPNGHAILFLQHTVWHEGYPHGQITPARKATGPRSPMSKLGQLRGMVGCRERVAGRHALFHWESWSHRRQIRAVWSLCVKLTAGEHPRWEADLSGLIRCNFRIDDDPLRALRRAPRP